MLLLFRIFQFLPLTYPVSGTPQTSDNRNIRQQLSHSLRIISLLLCRCTYNRVVRIKSSTSGRFLFQTGCPWVFLMIFYANNRFMWYHAVVGISFVLPRHHLFVHRLKFSDSRIFTELFSQIRDAKKYSMLLRVFSTRLEYCKIEVQSYFLIFRVFCSAMFKV